MPRAQKGAKTGAKPKPPTEPVHQQASKHVSLSVYISMVGVHTTLLAYAGLFLPRTAVLQQLAQYEAEGVVVSSQDRPQPEFFNALTQSPTITLAALCAGALILQTWWSSWLRGCWIDLSTHRSDEDKLKEKYLPTGKRAERLAQTYGVVVLASIILHLILILFGAPITETRIVCGLMAKPNITNPMVPTSSVDAGRGVRMDICVRKGEAVTEQDRVQVGLTVKTVLFTSSAGAYHDLQAAVFTRGGGIAIRRDRVTLAAASNRPNENTANNLPQVIDKGETP
ncbi:hypothetical protein NMY22_g5457 [Coprinellus aureogranulatus]|nr:hypothetical protein NMY22_g5457 [Coprinellus aureogranulatus]